jgi:putative RNA 2'-phosphotransferase
MSTERIKLQQLSRTISHALRHEPWVYELEIEQDGWITLSSLLSALRKEKDEWSDLNQCDIENMIRNSPKKRHEICGGKIRALYGHSLFGKFEKELAEPPQFLYHGTSNIAAEKIKIEGLISMSRQYVHLSIDLETATQVGQRKAKRPKILKIRAYEGFESGLRFYRGNDYVWLADSVPPDFISFSEK